MQSKALKNVLMIAGTALGAFLVALLGAYLVLPLAAPGVAEEADGRAEASADTSLKRASAPGEQDDDTTDTQAAPSEASVASVQEEIDDAQNEPEPAKDSTGAQPDTSRSVASNAGAMERLRDSLQTLQQRLRTAEKEVAALRNERETLREEKKTLRGELASLKNRQATVNELSKALMSMGQNELTTLLKKVDMRVLEALYQETSGRSRTRLLQAMSSDRAAQFVNDVVDQDSTETSATSTSPAQTAPAAN